MSDHRLVLPDNPDAAAFHLTRNEQGYVHTPWFSYDESEPHGTNGAQYRYMRVRRAAVEAFASILKISAFDVTITEKCAGEGSDERVFRLGTRFPVELPAAPAKKPNELSSGAIEI